MVVVPDALLEPAWVPSERAATALRAGRWAEATDALLAEDARALRSAQQADRAFVLAWAAIRADRASEVASTWPLVQASATAPASYRALTVAELQAAAGDRTAALVSLGQVDPDAVIAPRAQALRAEVLHGLGRTAEASKVLEAMVARPDPAPGSALAWLTLARRRGVGSEASYAALRHLWTWYPTTDEGRQAATLLAASYKDRTPTRDQLVRRAERFADAGAWSTTLDLLEEARATGEPASDACLEAWLAGRSLYKKNQLGDAVAAFGDAGSRCPASSEGPGHKILYMKGMAQFRKGQFAASARTYAEIADRYADTTFADDGLTRAGIALVEDGQPDAAMAMWRQALERFPDGDTVPEATFRMAFALYEDGRTEEAVKVADALGKLSQRADEVHVLAGRYWAARWRVYPDVRAPNQLSKDMAARQVALRAWERLAVDTPHHYYAALAWGRLSQLAPDVAARLRTSTARPKATPWQARPAFLAHPAVLRAAGLVQVGLVREGLAEWSQVDEQELTADEMAWFQDLRVRAGDWLAAHNDMHSWLRDHPLGTLGGREASVIRLAFPDRYLDEVRAATATAAYPPRYFHALVREESTFNKDIVSHAGARGLSQLMPATAEGVARKMGITVRGNDLFTPSINLRLGARYLDDVLRGQHGNFCLALAGYNAGPARVDGWVREGGNVPLDEFVERIPYRETRGYVKRVTSTWQTYQHASGTAPAYVDLTPFLASVRP